MKEQKWNHSDSHEIALTIEADRALIHYRIERDDYDNSWRIYRWAESSRNTYEDTYEPPDIEDGYLGRWREYVGIVCGSGLASAIGLPSFATTEDLSECKKICEEDFENLKNGDDILLIENEEFRKENMQSLPK